MYLKGPAQFNTTATSFDRAVDRGGIVEPEDAALEAGLPGDTVKRGGVPPSNDRCSLGAARRARDMLADVAGGSVDH